MAFRIDEFSDMPQTALIDATERTRFNTVGFGFAVEEPSGPTGADIQRPLLIFGRRTLGKAYVAGFTTDDGTAISSSIRTGALDQGAPRREKKYSDLAVEQEGAGEVITVTSTLDSQASTIRVLTFTASAVRTRILLDAFLDARGRNVVIDLAWSSGEPKIYFSAIRYLFDEAIETVRWSSEEIDHGTPGWVVPVYAHISMRSRGAAQLVVIAHRQDGTKQTATYVLPDTEDVKRKVFVPFRPMKGALIEYQVKALDSAAPFQLYRDETTIFVRPWGQAGLVPTKPIGDAVAVSSSEVANVRGVR